MGICAMKKTITVQFLDVTQDNEYVIWCPSFNLWARAKNQIDAEKAMKLLIKFYIEKFSSMESRYVESHYKGNHSEELKVNWENK